MNHFRTYAIPVSQVAMCMLLLAAWIVFRTAEAAYREAGL